MDSILEAAHQLPAREVGELLLVVADLVDVDVREARFLERANLLEVRLRVGTGGDRLGDVLHGDVPGCLLEVARGGQPLAARTGEGDVRPQAVRPPVPRLMRPA